MSSSGRLSSLPGKYKERSLGEMHANSSSSTMFDSVQEDMLIDRQSDEDLEKELNEMRRQHEMQITLKKLEQALSSHGQLIKDDSDVRTHRDPKQVYRELEKKANEVASLALPVNDAAQQVLRRQQKLGVDANKVAVGLANVFKEALEQIAFYQKRLDLFDQIRKENCAEYLEALKTYREEYARDMQKLRETMLEQRRVFLKRGHSLE